MSEREEHSSSASFELLDRHPAAAFRRHHHPNQATQITDEVMGDICLGLSEDRHEEEEEDQEEEGTKEEGNPQGQVAEGDELHLLETQHRSLIPYPRMIANQDGIPREAPKKKKKKRHRDRQWLLDRVHGDSKFNETKPPCFICYVPLPIKWWPNLMETNAAFEAMGKVGIFHPNNQKARSILIGFGLLSNILGTMLVIYTLVGVTMDYDILQVSSFHRGKILTKRGEVPNYQSQVGLRAVAVQSPIDGEQVIPFDHFCDQNVGFAPFLEKDQCYKCERASFSMIPSLVISAIFYIPNLTTDTLRLYAHYDCNCQKAFAGFFAIISIAMALQTWIVYQRRCFVSFYSGDTYFNADREKVDSDDPSAVFLLDFQWHPGVGLNCLKTASFLKVLDMLCNLAIPTPSITRSRLEQELYERLYGPASNDRTDDDHDTGMAEVELRRRSRLRTRTLSSGSLLDLYSSSSGGEALPATAYGMTSSLAAGGTGRRRQRRQSWPQANTVPE